MIRTRKQGSRPREEQVQRPGGRNDIGCLRNNKAASAVGVERAKE